MLFAKYLHDDPGHLRKTCTTTVAKIASTSTDVVYDYFPRRPVNVYFHYRRENDYLHYGP